MAKSKINDTTSKTRFGVVSPQCVRFWNESIFFELDFVE